MAIPTMPTMSAVLEAFREPSMLPAFQRLVTCAEKYIPTAPAGRKNSRAMIDRGQYADGLAGTPPGIE